MEVSRIQSLGRDPIPGGDPAGENARYDAEYEQAAAEIGKLESIEREPVDYYQVERLCMDLLDRRTKDLKVASWLTVALYRESGAWGLAHGFGLCRDLLLNFWDGMFPPLKRQRARMTLLEWLAEIVEKDFETLPEPTENDRDALEVALDNLESLEQIARDKFTDELPALGPALRAIRARIGAIPAPEPEPEPESITPVVDGESPPLSVAPAAPLAAPEPREMASAEDVVEALADWRAEMRKAAAILRRDDPSSPAGYRLLREACWGDLHQLPSTDEGRLAVACAGDEFLARVEKLFEEEEFEEALDLIEDELANSPLWLDLNLLSCRALEELGRKHRKVKRAIERGVASLLAYLPTLVDVQFSDGRPIANEETRIWIENELVANAADDDANVAGPASVEMLSAEAKRLMSRKKVNEAITLLVRHIESASSRRARFLLRLELARLCVESGKPEMSVPQLDLLEQEVQTFSLEEWEPDLSIQVVRLLWQCCSGRKKVESLSDRADSIYERLCRLDPAAAFSMKKP